MRKPTKQEINDFIEYRANHVALVQKLGKVALDMDFSHHDEDKINAVGKDLELFALRNAYKHGKLRTSDEDKNILRKVSAKHALNSKHHLEYWDPSINMRNFNEEDQNVVHISRMPDRYLAESMSDWSAAGMYHNEPIFQWYNDHINTYIIATDRQKEFMKDCLTKIQNAVEKYKISYPGKEYTAEQVEPLEEKILKRGSKWVVTDHTGKKNLGTYDTKAAALKRLRQVEYFKHLHETGFFYNTDNDDEANSIITEGIHTNNLSMITLEESPKGKHSFFVFPLEEGLIDDVSYKDIPASNVLNLTEEVCAASFAGMVPEHVSSVVNPVPGEDPIKTSGLKESKSFRDFITDHLESIQDAPEFSYLDYLSYINGEM